MVSSDGLIEELANLVGEARAAIKERDELRKQLAAINEAEVTRQREERRRQEHDSIVEVRVVVSANGSECRHRSGKSVRAFAGEPYLEVLDAENRVIAAHKKYDSYEIIRKGDVAQTSE